MELDSPLESSDVGADAPQVEEGVLEEVRRFWDADAATYDNSSSHRPRDPAVWAAWTRALARVLPPPPARVLDAGAGTGFLSLIAAQLGHVVTALDLSQKMLERLKEVASSAQLEIETVLGSAQSPRASYDVVMERHLLWTLPHPDEALLAWHRAAQQGRLILFESVWGDVDRVEQARSRVRHLIRTMRRVPSDHHASYSGSLRQTLPLGSGTAPSRLVEMVTDAGWHSPQLERLRDVEWAERCALPPLERVVGVPPRFIITAD